MTIQTVDRPDSHSNVKDELIERLIALKGTDKALRIELGPETHFINWQSTLRNRLAKRNLRLHARLNKADRSVTCWVADI